MSAEQKPDMVRRMLETADWNDIKRLPATKDTNFWFYSISAVHGPRIMFNVTRPLLDDAKSGSGKISTIKRMMNPLDGYTSAIQAFDDAKDFSEKISPGEPLALAMTAYAIEQKSWLSLLTSSPTSPC